MWNGQILEIVKDKINRLKRRIKSPKMLWGYRDASGQWRSGTRISDTVCFYHPEKIQISDHVFIWHYSILDGTGGICIGEGTQIGAWVGLFTHSSHIAIRLYGKHYQDVIESDKKGYPTAAITIGKYVFVGANSIIFPGVSIGDGALISAGTLVKRNVAAYEIVSGQGTETVGDTRHLDKRYLKDLQLAEWYQEWQMSHDLSRQA